MIPFGPHLDGFHDVADQMIDDLRRRAERLLAAQSRRKAEITTIEQFEAHRRQVRERYLAAIGGLPIADGEARPPLRAEITGGIDRGGFTIEKLLYQSLPGVYVTANVYVPKRIATPAPAVLFVCGHSELAKAYPVYQSVCIDLAENGFVALAMDPPGQGERFQYWDPATGRRVIGGCTTEHTYTGLQMMVQGGSISRWFTWDAIRAVDYLCSRPEVDPARIGVTGNSGGGTQSCLMMLAEPRLAAAMPCTFVMTLESYHATGQAQDAEQLIAGCFVNGPDHDDYLTMMAPKPVRVGAVAYDFFPIEGTLEAVERAKRIYALYGAEDRVDVAVTPDRHEYSKGLRAAAVEFFGRYLGGPNGARGVSAERETLPEPELWVTPRGQVLDAFPQGRTLFQLSRELTSERPAGVPAGPEELRRSLAERLGVGDAGRGGAIHARIIHEGVLNGYPVEKLFFFSEPGICVSAVLVHPRGTEPVDDTTVLLLENGTASAEAERPLIESILRAGSRVLVFDPRGIGGVESRPFSGAPPHDREWRLGCDAMMMGTSTLGLRVFDILRAYDYLARERKDVNPDRVFIHGKGSGAVWAWLAAALEPRLAGVTAEGMLWSIANLVETELYASRLFGLKNLAFGLLPELDLPDLLPLLAPRPVRVVDLIDAHGERVDAGVYRDRAVERLRRAGRLPEGWEVG